MSSNNVFKFKQLLCCRQTYLEMRFREYDLDKFGILKRSQEIQDKEGKRIDLIKTIKSKLCYNFIIVFSIKRTFYDQKFL